MEQIKRNLTEKEQETIYNIVIKTELFKNPFIKKWKIIEITQILNIILKGIIIGAIFYFVISGMGFATIAYHYCINNFTYTSSTASFTCKNVPW